MRSIIPKSMEAVLASIAQVHANLKCPICKEELKRPIASIPCGHDFCESCIILSLESHGAKCPVCQQPCWRSGIVRNQMLENVVSRLQDAKKPPPPPPPATPTSGGRNPRLVPASSQGPANRALQEKSVPREEGCGSVEAAAISTSREADGSRGPSNRIPTSAPSSERHKRTRDRQEQSGRESGKLDKRKRGATGLKGREAQSIRPQANVEATAGAVGALERRIEQPGSEKSERELAGTGPTLDFPEEGDAIRDVEDLGGPLNTQAESVLEAEIAEQEEELKEIDEKLVAMGIDPALYLSQVTTEHDEEEPVVSPEHPGPAPQASQGLQTVQPEQRNRKAAGIRSVPEKEDVSGGLELAQPATCHDAVGIAERNEGRTEEGTVSVSGEVPQVLEEAETSEAGKTRTAGVTVLRAEKTRRGLALSGRTERAREGLQPSSSPDAEKTGAVGRFEDKNESFTQGDGEAAVGLEKVKGGSAEKGSGGLEPRGGFQALDAATDPFAFDKLTDGSQENATPGRVTSGGQAVVGRSASKRGKGSEAHKQSRTPKKRLKVDSAAKKVGTATQLVVRGRSKAGEAARESARLGTTGGKGGAAPAEPSFLDAPVEEPAAVAYTRRKRGPATSPATGKSADSGLGSNNEAGIGARKRLRETRRGYEIEPGENSGSQRKGENSGSGRKGKQGEGSDKRRREMVEGSDEEGEQPGSVRGTRKALGLPQSGGTGVEGCAASEAKKGKRAVGKSPGAGVAPSLEVAAESENAAGEMRPQQVGGKGRDVNRGAKPEERVIAETASGDGFSDWGLGLEENDLDEQGLVRGAGNPDASTHEPVKSAGAPITGPRPPAARKMPDEEGQSEKPKVAEEGSRKDVRRIAKSKSSKGGKQTRKPLRDLSQRPRGRPQEGDYKQDLREALARSLADA